MRTKMSFSKQILSIFLCLALMLTYVPSTAFAATSVTHNGLTISGGTEGTDFAFNQEVLCIDGEMSNSNSLNKQGIKILSSQVLTLSGTLGEAGRDYTGIYIPSGVTAYLTLDDATINGGYITAPITVEGTLYLTLTGSNVITPYDLNAGTTVTSTAGIWVLENGSLVITEESTGSLTIEADYGNAAIGQTSYATSAGFGDGTKYSGANKAGSITINGGTLNLTSEGSNANVPRAYYSGAAIGSAQGGDFTSIIINGGIINAESYSGAAIGAGWKDPVSATPTGSVTINGGTINATGGQFAYHSTNYTSDGVGGSTEATTGGVTITGGSVKNTVSYNRPTNGADDLYLATITLDGISSATAVSAITYYLNSEKNYTVNNMQTMEGKLYLWLPEGAVVSSVTADGKNYTGNLLVRDDDSAEGTFYTGTTYTVSLAENSNVTDSLPYGNTFAAGATVYVQVDADEGYAVTGVDTTENPSSYTWVDGNIYSFIMPANAATVYVTAQQVALPDTLDLSYGDITFGYDADKNCRYLTYYTSDGTTKTVNYIPAGQTYTITQSNSSAESTANTIKVENWDKFTGDELPLKLTISNLNINADTGAEGSESLSENLIAINSSTVELTLVGTSTLTSSVTTAANREVALLGVDGTSELTITQGSNGSLTSTAAGGRGAAIGGDCVGDTGDGVACGIINIKGGTIAAVIGDEEDGRVGYGAAIGSGRIGTGGTVNISGGEVTATSHGAGAAIGSGTLGTAFTVNVSGGKVIARNTYGSSDGGAAIGSGSNGAAYVIISGGEVEATAFRGAAIGSGDSGDATVAISDGTVIAHAAGSYAYGAGIGSGAYGEATVTISGGSITASTGGTSGTYAAAIGGGGSGNSSTSNATVTITGGDINATGSSYTPAIGSGYSGSSNANATVSISGGNINVDNDTVATIGLGGGNNSTATVTITGGSVNGKKRTTTTSFTDGNSNEVYLITATLSDADAAVTGSITGENYSFNGVKTNSEGKIFLWLPGDGTTETKAAFNGSDYTGVVKTDNTGVFTINCDHSGNTNKPNDNGDGTHDATCSDCGAMVVDNEKHTLTCSASDNTITVSCSINCGYTGTATISATSKTYDGTAAEVIVTKTGDLESENIAITYVVKDGEALTEAPVNADTYTASITLGDKTVSVEFTIAPVTITADMITVNSTVYNGETQIPKSNHVTVTVGGVVLEHNVDYSIGVYPDHEFINAYEYPITIYGEGNYTGSVETTFNIKAKSLTDGMVTISGDVNYSGSEQKPTVTVKDGTEALIEGTDYTVSFPEDMTNAGAKTITITGKGNYSGEITKTFNIVDETEPTGEILIKDNGWKQFWNWITFGIFCKDNVDVTITADGTGSGIAKVEYLLSGTALDENNLPTDGWTELTANDGKYSFSITPQNKTAVYVRITDEYNNVTVINSDGIVVYQDSVAVDTEVTYTYNENNNKDVAVYFNGNTVKSIVCGEAALAASTDYTVDYDNGKIVLNAAYLNTLNASDTAYTFTVSYDPMGVANSGVTDLADTTFAVKVNKAQISTVTVDVTAPEAGAAKQNTVAGGTGYGAVITWDGDTDKFGYNTTYTATVTLTADNNHKFASGLTASGWNVVVSADGTTATLTKTFEATRKAKLTAISAPTDSTLNKYYTDVADAIKELPTTVAYTTESGNVTVNIEWACSNYDYAVTKTNTFTWKVKDGELTNYDENNIATTGEITVTNASAITVNNSGENKTVTYSGSTYDVAGMFTIDKNAGEASYAITGGTGTGTLNGSVLTITKAGTIEIKLTTAANGAYAAGEATATLTVNKGAGSGTVTIEGWTYGEDANAPVVNSSTNGNASVTYLYESTDGKGYNDSVAPENAGSYKLTVTFAETDLYEDCTDDTTFTIEQKELIPVLSGSVSKIYDGTNTVPGGATITLNGLVGNDEVKANASYAYDGVNVGTTKINATGITLSGADAGNYKLTATSVSADIGEITKATPQYDVPTGLTATYGDTLVDVTLPEGFTWEDALTTAVGNVGNSKFTVTYTPDDTTNFNTVTGIEVSIEVKAAAASVATAPTAISGLIYNKTAQALITAGTANGGEMQYSLSKDSGYSTTIPTGTGAGTYTVWYKVVGDSNHSDTAPVSIEIKIGKADPAIGTVTAGVVNDTLEISAIELDRSNTVVDGVLSVDAGQELKLGDNQIAYTFTPADTNNYETVIGKVTVTVKDTIAPTGKVEFVNRTGWESFVNTITFGLFYKDEVTVKAEANDSFSGINSIEYATSDKAMTLDEVKAITDWTAMPTNGVGVTVEDTKQFVYFVRITDNAGNVTYLSTDGAEYDITVPVISGIENGKTYYTTQKVTVSDKNLATVTLNDEAVTGTITLDGNKDATYTIVATDKAGNSTTVTVTMKPISDLSAPIDTLTKDNVNSSNEQAVDNVKAVAEAVDTTNATDAEKEALKAITDKVAELEKVIDDTKAEITRINNELKKYDGNTVNSDDAEALEQLGKDIKALTDGGNLTDAEKAALTEAASDVAEMQKTVEDTVAENKRISDAVDSYDLTTVTSDDKTDLEQLLADINKQLESTNLTEEEISELNGDKKAVEDLLTKIKGTDELIDKLTEDVDGYSEDTVKSTDKDAIEQIIEDIDALLETENLTEDEKKALEDAKAKAEDLLDAIDEAAQAPATDNTEKVKDVTAENVTPEDKTDLENAKADLEKALEENGGNYTEDEKKAIEDEIKRIEDALKVIENVEAVEDQINNLPENITKDDTDDVDAAKKAYDGLSDYEKTLIDPNTKKKLEAAIKAAEEANKPADTDSPQTGDNTNMPALFALMFGSLAAMFAVIFGGKKKKKAEDK